MDSSPTWAEPNLAAYLKRHANEAAWGLVSRRVAFWELQLQSQIWQGSPWTHALTGYVPDDAGAANTALLIVTGDRADRDDEEMQMIARLAHLPAFTLYDTPNQPLLGDLREDALVVESWARALESGDQEWNLLFPMVRAVLAAMDAIIDLTDGQVQRFVVNGVSKRGWTSWLAACCGDERIVGSAPMSFDNLHFKAQMDKQLRDWAAYSPRLDDYTAREMQELLASEEGRALSGTVDPYFSLNGLRSPVLLVNGANDEYWTVDALGVYFHDIPSPKYVAVIPNVGHDLGDRHAMRAVLAAFARACSGIEPMPDPRWTYSHRGNQFAVDLDPSTLRDERLVCRATWLAHSANRRFEDVEWTPCEGAVEPKTGSYTAVLPQATFRSAAGFEFSLSAPVTVLSPN